MWRSFLQGCTSTQQLVLLYTGALRLYCPPPTHTHTLINQMLIFIRGSWKTLYVLIQAATLGCSVYHSSMWQSNFQASKASSTSPRKLLRPNRSWCHMDTCRVRVSSCEWLITYWERGSSKKKKKNPTREDQLNVVLWCNVLIHCSLALIEFSSHTPAESRWKQG